MNYFEMLVLRLSGIDKNQNRSSFWNSMNGHFPVLACLKKFEDLLLEQSLEQKNEMLIYSAGFSIDIGALLSFLAFLLVALCSGYFGPKETLVETNDESFLNFPQLVAPKFGYTLKKLLKITRFISVNLIMERKPEINPMNGVISVLITGKWHDIVGPNYSQTIDPFPTIFREADLFSEPIHIFLINQLIFLQ
jgi:hypothetical protein